MKQADIQKITQLITSSDSANQLLALQFIETFNLIRDFITDISYLAYFTQIRREEKVRETAHKFFTETVSEKLATELYTNSRFFHFPEEVLQTIGVLFKEEHKASKQGGFGTAFSPGITILPPNRY